MSPPSVETASTTAAADRSLFPASQSRVERLRDRFHQIRKFTNALCAGLEPEDCVVQSMPDVSPTKWHLAHTTWFFETFILKKFVPGYRAEIPEYAYLFNSYYNAAGDMHRRDLRGLISRPTLSQAQRYRASVDSHIDDLLSNPDESLLDEIEPILVLGIHHEQQHQELLITDIKHVLAQNPLYPVFRAGRARSPSAPKISTDGSAESVPTSLSNSTNKSLKSAMMATDSPMTTKGRGIEHSSPRFRWQRGRSQMANTSRSSRTTAIAGRNSGYRSAG